MPRTTARLTPEHLEALEAPCRSCVFWETDAVRRSEVTDPVAAKAAWLEQVLGEWGTCGQVALVDDVPVGYLVYAPAAYVPGAAAFPTAPVSPDAVLLTTAYVAAGHTGGGLGRLLVQKMARDLVRREVRAVEAFGDTRGRGPCRLPVDFLSGVGFNVQRAHSTTPRMRMELRSTVTATLGSGVEAVVERLVGAVRPAPRPTNGQAMNSESSLSRVALGRAPTIDFTTSPPW